eukprot:TRINITY_DN5592_c0_g1_i4.p1 TRINITY_DN5592_c0_g1~~TRINITY_DN5592_c0_g1_i4.p1  ORF type:complete len:111 (-),score=14.55 TRINITY_DN5592_c0_g1_i4:47-379(-)
MQTLDFSTVWINLTEERLISILDTKPIQKLCTLNLSYCNRINFYSIQKLGTLPCLTSLNLSHWLQMTSREWDEVAQLTTLKTLVVNCTGVAVPLKCLTNLTNLTCLECGT